MMSTIGLVGHGPRNAEQEVARPARAAGPKYTCFGVHPAAKHLSNGPGILPNINCLRVYMGGFSILGTLLSCFLVPAAGASNMYMYVLDIYIYIYISVCVQYTHICIWSPGTGGNQRHPCDFG